MTRDLDLAEWPAIRQYLESTPESDWKIHKGDTEKHHAFLEHDFIESTLYEKVERIAIHKSSGEG